MSIALNVDLYPPPGHRAVGRSEVGNVNVCDMARLVNPLFPFGPLRTVCSRPFQGCRFHRREAQLRPFLRPQALLSQPTKIPPA